MAPTLLMILLVQPHLFMCAAAQSNQLKAPSSMTPTQRLTSTSGIFAFGFCNVDPSINPTQLLLAIWFDFGASDCTNKTVVWFARDPSSNDAVIASEQAVLTLDGSSNSSLFLVDHQSTLWSPSQQQVGSTLMLLDSGNLQLHTSGGDGVSWQSFDHPTHTLIPGQNLTYSPGTYLLSKNTDTDFSPGRFALAVQDDANIVLYMRNLDQISSVDAKTGDPYWALRTTWKSSKVPTIVFDDSGNLFYNDSVNGYGNLTKQQPPNSAQSYYHYAALDPDGSVRVYARQKNNTDDTVWDVVSLFPDDGCDMRTSDMKQGFCGTNSYCKMSSLEEQRLSCECPDGYVFADEQHKYIGCRANFNPHICDGRDHSGEFTTAKIDNITWSTESAYNRLPTASLQQCTAGCLKDCSCLAVLIDGASCMSVQNLTYGKQGSSNKMTTLIKVSAINSPILSPGNKLSRKWLYVIIASLGTSLLTSVVCNFRQCYASEKARKRRLLTGLRTFTYKELKQATNGFRELLGKGGFGEVHKGKLSHLQPPHVAVKTLFEWKGETDFENEVSSIGHIHHKNLVRLIGYCNEGSHRMLVFEYMQGGTLADFIFASERPCWSFLAEAAIGIARGLEYLHEGCQPRIIHCDIKPDNILFDDKHTPKITDFGIAKLLGDQKAHHTITRIAGTRSYLAPEWFYGEGRVDSKVDVYSFGVVLLEMICCKKASVDGLSTDSHEPNTQSNLRAWAEELIRNGRSAQLVQGESEALTDMESVERFARVAIWCLQKDPSMRPNMHKVVQMLETTIEVDRLPDPPNFSTIFPNPINGGTIHSSSNSFHTLHIE